MMCRIRSRSSAIASAMTLSDFSLVKPEAVKRERIVMQSSAILLQCDSAYWRVCIYLVVTRKVNG